MDRTLFSLTSILLLLTVLWGAWRDYDREWKPYQQSYNTLVQQKVSDEKLRQAIQPEKLQVRQIVVPQLGRVDRCPTCHIAFDNPNFSDGEEPLRSHSGILDHHPVEKYGCTICHGGQGMATTYRGAAHDALEFWEEPMLKGDYLQASCGKCHREPSVAGAPILAVARTLYKDEFVCDTCHQISGEGGTDGPELTFIGSKPLHTFDFTHLAGERSKARWFQEHFLDPQAVIPTSEMVNQGMTPEQAKALTIMMLGLSKNRIPADYLVSESRPQAATGEQRPTDSLVLGEMRIFEEKQCILCHTLRGRGGKVGPDLTQVAGRRNADWLFQHFKNPRAVVPGSKMPDMKLTDEEANDLTRYMLSLKSGQSR